MFQSFFFSSCFEFSKRLIFNLFIVISLRALLITFEFIVLLFYARRFFIVNIIIFNIIIVKTIIFVIICDIF